MIEVVIRFTSNKTQNTFTCAQSSKNETLSRILGGVLILVVVAAKVGLQLHSLLPLGALHQVVDHA